MYQRFVRGKAYRWLICSGLEKENHEYVWFLHLQLFNFYLLVASLVVVYVGVFNAMYGRQSISLFYLGMLAGTLIPYYFLYETKRLDLALLVFAFAYFSLFPLKYIMVGSTGLSFYIWMSAPAFASLLIVSRRISLIYFLVYFSIIGYLTMFVQRPLASQFPLQQNHERFSAHNNYLAIFLFFSFFIIFVFIYRSYLQRLKQVAHTDMLTGLANRLLLENDLNQRLAQTASPPRFTVVYFDLNKFKSVNDNFGHAVGDEILKMVADRVREFISHELEPVIKGTAICARVGGDEFVMLINDVLTDELLSELLDKLQLRLKQNYYIDGENHFCSASIGVASTRWHFPDKVFDYAESAMRQVKQQQLSTWREYQVVN